MIAGRALDALVAEKILGCTVKWFGDEPACECNEDRPHAHMDGTLRNFSTDIAAAWEVVGKFGYCYLWNHPGIGGWECKLIKDDEDRFYAREVETAPLAICLAALKAVEGK
jgi:hypothetical protein